MAGSNFVLISSPNNAAVLSGSASKPTPFVEAIPPHHALSAVNTGLQPGMTLDRLTFDLALASVPPPVGASFLALGKFVGGFVKSGCVYIVLAGSTVVNLDLQSLGAFTGATAQAGDTTFATINALVFNNLGSQDVTISPGATNPARLPKLLGTTPTLGLAAGGAVCVFDVAGQAVDSTHRIITITPTAGGVVAVACGGA